MPVLQDTYEQLQEFSPLVSSSSSMCPPPPGCDPNYLGMPVPLLPPPLHHPLGPQGRGQAGGRRGELGRGGDLQGTMEEREEREREISHGNITEAGYQWVLQHVVHEISKTRHTINSCLLQFVQ